MQILENHSLKPYHTFGFDVKAKQLALAQSIDDIREVAEWYKAKPQDLLILGGGSNVLFTHDLDETVLINQLKGIEVIQEDENSVWVEVKAGEVWHEFVMWTIENGFGGLENLSLIPGSVGAAPMQNIGAYGAEIKQTFVSLNAIELSTGSIHAFDNKTCEFGYRSSIFKTSVKGEFAIASVTFKLAKQPVLNTSYGAIEMELERMGVEPTLRSVSDAVIHIRQSKLPDPKQIGNAGSFFKNPVISKDLFDSLKSKYEDMPGYPAPNGVKVAAGWLIEKAGWKGKTFDNYGVHKKQALVLVNYGGATGKQVFDLSEQIIGSIQNQFGIALEREVNII